jgi:hypothetical protein
MPWRFRNCFPLSCCSPKGFRPLWRRPGATEQETLPCLLLGKRPHKVPDNSSVRVRRVPPDSRPCFESSVSTRIQFFIARTATPMHAGSANGLAGLRHRPISAAALLVKRAHQRRRFPLGTLSRSSRTILRPRDKGLTVPAHKRKCCPLQVLRR